LAAPDSTGPIKNSSSEEMSKMQKGTEAATTAAKRIKKTLRAKEGMAGESSSAM